jgi:hypothetical protein
VVQIYICTTPLFSPLETQLRQVAVLCSNPEDIPHTRYTRLYHGGVSIQGEDPKRLSGALDASPHGEASDPVLYLDGKSCPVESQFFLREGNPVVLLGNFQCRPKQFHMLPINYGKHLCEPIRVKAQYLHAANGVFRGLEGYPFQGHACTITQSLGGSMF